MRLLLTFFATLAAVPLAFALLVAALYWVAYFAGMAPVDWAAVNSR